jgi:hypothetical protein
MGEQGIQKLALVLEQNQALKILKIANNLFTPSGYERLLDALKNNCFLTELDIGIVNPNTYLAYAMLLPSYNLTLTKINIGVGFDFNSEYQGELSQPTPSFLDRLLPQDDTTYADQYIEPESTFATKYQVASFQRILSQGKFSSEDWMVGSYRQKILDLFQTRNQNISQLAAALQKMNEDLTTKNIYKLLQTSIRRDPDRRERLRYLFPAGQPPHEIGVIIDALIIRQEEIELYQDQLRERVPGANILYPRDDIADADHVNDTFTTPPQNQQPTPGIISTLASWVWWPSGKQS